MPQDQAVFTEMLEVSVQTDQFKAGLAELEKEYKDFLSRLGEGVSARDVIDISQFGAINASLTELANSFAQVRSAIADTMTGLAQSINDGFTSVESTVSEKMQQTVASVSKAGGEVVEEQSATVRRVISEIEAGLSDQTRITSLSTQSQAKVWQELWNLVQTRGEGVLKNLTDANQKWYDAQIRTVEGAIAADEKLAAARQKTLKSADDGSLAKEQQQQQARLAGIKVLEAELDKLNAKNQPLLDRVFGRFFEDLPEAAAGILRITLLFTAAHEAINLVVSAAELLPKAFEEGWEYLARLEEKAEELKGVIASNVELSGNFGENLRLSEEAAEAVQKRLEDIAANDNLKLDNLVTGFKAFLESGGANLVNNLNEATRATELFSLALKASGVSVETTRKLVSEIPSLINGSISPSSKLLEVLHLSKDEWEQIRQEAIAHHDLIPQLEARMSAYVAVVQEANQRHDDLQNSIKVMSDRLFAVLAKPLWDWWTEKLQEAKGWFEQNHNELSAISVTFGEFLKSVVSLVEMAAKIVWNFSGLKPLFDGLLIAAVALAEAFNVIVNGVMLVSKDVISLVSLLADPNTWKNPKAAFQKFWDDAAASADKYVDQVKQSVLRVHDVLTGDNQSAGNQSGILNQNAPASTAIIDRSKTNGASKLQELRAEMNEELKAVQSNESQIRDIYKRAVSERTLSQQEATDVIKASFTREEDAVNHIAGKYRELASQIKGVKETALDSFNAQTRVIEQEAAKRASAGDTSADKAAQDAQRKADDQIRAIEYQSAQAHKTQMLSVAKAEASGGLILKSATFKQERDLETNAYEYQRDLLIQAFNDAGADYEKRRVITVQLEALAKAHNDKLAAIDAQYDAAKKKERDEDLKHAQTMDNLELQAEIQSLERQRDVTQSDTQRAALTLKIDEAKKKLIQTTYAHTLAVLEEQAALTTDADALTKLKDKIAEVEKERDNAIAAAQGQTAKDTQDSTYSIWSIFGPKVKSAEDFDNMDAPGKIEAVGNAFKNLQGIISNIQSGFKQGGTLGGIGSILGAASQFDPEPISRAVLGVASGVMSFLGGLFTAAAQRLAEKIKKAFDDVVTNYQNGSITLQQAIQQTEAEREQAIIQLSGKKGGKDQLNQLLPEFDKEIADLQKQQQQILTNFDDELTVLRLHSDELGNALKTWQDINKQVQDYLGAGGDAAKAAEFLSLSLQKLQQTSQDSLDEGESQAIQDMLQLNDLLQQRVQLVEDFKKQEFDLINGDAIEKRSTAIDTGQQLAALRTQYQQQLDDLDSQIDLTQKKVDMENTIFNLATDLASLHREDEALQLAALQKQIDQWKSLQQIVSGIMVGADGNYKLTTGLALTIGAININGLGTETSTDLAAQISTSLSDVITNEYRKGSFNPYGA